MVIINKEGKIGENLYLIDLNQYGRRYITSAFLYYDGNLAILMDIGTSDNVSTVLRFLRKNDISLSKLKGICGTHYHFDHMGGATALWRRVVKKNSSFKIYVPKDTHDFLQNADTHLVGARTTFGDFVGSMRPAPEEAYYIVEKDSPLPFDLAPGWELRLISTPGHSPDHCAPTLFRNNKPFFIFAGEACGTLFHSTKLVSVPSSMPPNFRYDIYMKSLERIGELSKDSEIMGFCHYGAISGNADIATFISEHKTLMETFRRKIMSAFNENPSTKYVMEKTAPLWQGRFDERLTGGVMEKRFLDNLRLALTYGQMVDLGFRKSKYEKRIW